MNAALDGIRIVACTANIPGPTVCRRLADLGASVVKIEAPEGDALQAAVPDYYAELNAGFEIRRLDLKNPDHRGQLETLLADADLWLTTVRAAALATVELDAATLGRRFPDLCRLAIAGYPPPDRHRPGHDLNYQAGVGLVSPPALPASLFADIAGAEQAVSAALALLLGRARTGEAGHREVALAEAADALATPVRFGLTRPGGLLAGALPFYGCYRCADDRWIACGLLEPKFVKTFMAEAGLEDLTAESMGKLFATQAAAHWVRWARKLDLPISLLVEP